MFGGLYRPPHKVSLPTQKSLGHLPIIEVLAADPEHPHEVDDAFAVINRPSHPLEVYVVLARGGLIPYTSDEFQQAFQRQWSVYTSDEPIQSATEQYRPMVDDVELVSDSLSLVEDGKLRPGLALYYKLAKGSGRTYGQEVRHVAVKPTQKTYEQFGEELLNGEHEEILLAVNAIRRFAHRRPLGIYHDMVGDTKIGFNPTELFARKIVQEMMVHANKEFGRIPDKEPPFPRRVTRKVSVDFNGRLTKSTDENASSVTRAYYSSHRGIHEPLETRSYTHTTSPLRRFIDLLAHQIWEAHVVEGFNVNHLHGPSLTNIIRHINRQIDIQAVRIGRDF